MSQQTEFIAVHLEGHPHLISREILGEVARLRREGQLREILNLLEIPNTHRNSSQQINDLLNAIYKWVSQMLVVSERGIVVKMRVYLNPHQSGEVYTVIKVGRNGSVYLRGKKGPHNPVVCFPCV